MKVKVKKVTVKMISSSQNYLKQVIVSQNKEQLGEAHDRITLHASGKLWLFFRVTLRKRNFMVSAKSSKWGLYNWNMKLKNLSKTRSSSTKPGSRIKATLPKQPKQKCWNEQKTLVIKTNKTTVKQSLPGNVDWQFCLRGFAHLGWLVLFVCFDLFCLLLFWVLHVVYILINVTNFLRNEHYVYIFDGEKTMPVFWKNKVCMQINAFWAWRCGECGNAKVH